MGLFIYYKCKRNDIDRAFEALIGCLWTSCALTIIIMMAFVIDWLNWTRNKNELVTASGCATIEVLLLVPAVNIALLSDPKSQCKSVGKARWPWNKFCRV